MNYSNIKFNDIANGEGVRTSLFVSGCTHHCKNCFNNETWDVNYGKPFNKDIQNKIISMSFQREKDSFPPPPRKK